jgi:hypothetical protein
MISFYGCDAKENRRVNWKNKIQKPTKPTKPKKPKKQNISSTHHHHARQPDIDTFFLLLSLAPSSFVRRAETSEMMRHDQP